ncbi:Protein cft1 [Cyphellophora attinorum]|uniref:Protein cft1 n=1 Tax=Cyphellophora attinorum TaxID=1664694 RepID=A0A0N1HH74_9EURO|nr:Protein cft1 [Phialophora attinorum]KPI45233.1 Protein cft1 [Phialophora attinorum]
MQCYSELVPASGVTHSLALPFTSSDGNNLIVARRSLLQIYRRVTSNDSSESKLALIREYHLAGTITGIGRVRLENTKSGGDAILIAFRDAKLSLVEWDASQNSISTISIHFYENHVLQSAPWLPDLRDCVSHLSIDPNSRCAAFNFGVNNLAIVPFHQQVDDLEDGDMDDVGEGNAFDRTMSTANGAADGHRTPYSPSFVLPMTTLDPVLLHPVDLTFLHEYRDPTIGILYSTSARSSNMAAERKDVMTYSVYALDLDQRASTNLQTVPNLPNDLNTVVGLPLPVSGSLLIGGNELIHIDQGGKATGIAVNEFAREASAFPLTDQSKHGLRLEGCQVVQLDRSNGDILIILRTGALAVLSFRLDGRSVSGISLKKLDDLSLSHAVRGRSTCTAVLISGEIFIGSDEADCVLIGQQVRPGNLKRQTSRVQPVLNGHGHSTSGADETAAGVGGDDEDSDDDEDDIFANVNGGLVENGYSSNTKLAVLDTLPTIAPLHQSAFGKIGKRKREDDDAESTSARVAEGLEFAVSYGKQKSGGIAFYSQAIHPTTKRRLGHGKATSIWSCCKGASTSSRFIVSENTPSDGLASSLWSNDKGSMSRVYDTAFEDIQGKPIAVGRFDTSQHTIYLTGSEIRVYDAAFDVSQILPIVDEDEDLLARAVSADFAEPYMTILKDDRTFMLLKADKSGELEELELPTTFAGTNFTSASLYLDKADYFQSSRFLSASSEPVVLLVCLATNGALSITPLANLKVQIFHFDSTRFLTPQLGPDVKIEKHWRNGDDLAAATLYDVGDEAYTHPHLVVRNTTGDVVVYEPFSSPEVAGSFKFRKVLTHNADYTNNDSTAEEDGEADQTLPPMQPVVSSGYAAVLIPGDTAKILIKTASSALHIYPLGERGQIVALCAAGQSDSDLIYVDDSHDLCQTSIPEDLVLGLSPWVARRKVLGSEVSSLAYYEGTASYVVATHELPRFNCLKMMSGTRNGQKNKAASSQQVGHPQSSSFPHQPTM